jgi:hypothetical protein
MSFGEGKQPFGRFYSWMVTLIVKHYTLVDVTGDLVWHKQGPPKVSILAWRLLRDRLPTKTNLLRRGIIQPVTIRCVAGCEFDESAPHLFLHCDIFGSLWQHIRTWIDVSGVEPYNIHDHFIQFTNSIGTWRTPN